MSLRVASQTAWVTYWKFKIGLETQKTNLLVKSKIDILSKLVAFSKNTNFNCLGYLKMGDPLNLVSIVTKMRSPLIICVKTMNGIVVKVGH